MLSLLIIIVLSYLAGSIPFSIIAGKIVKGIDIREHGSGNAGATNVIRVLGWKTGVVVFPLDIAKGLIAVLFIAKFSLTDAPLTIGSYVPDQSLISIIAGMSAVFGHIWTVFAGFRGGKGVATIAGVLFGLAPVEMSICLAVFFLVVIPTRYVSLGSILAGLALSIIVLVRRYILIHDIPQPVFIFSFVVSLLIIYTHRTNIKRLLNGTESKFGQK